MQPLFLTPSVEFEKTSAQTQLSEDPNSWSHELLQELYKQAPYIADFSPHVVMEKVDGEKGYGLGHVEVGNQTEVQTAITPSAAQAAGLRHIRIPVVIKDGMLCPFDLLVSDDSKVLPLTEVRLRAAIFRPQAFDTTSRTPGDQSMIGQLYPPYRQSYGFGGGGGLTTNMGMGKEGSALEEFLGGVSKLKYESDKVTYESGGIKLSMSRAEWDRCQEKTAGDFQDFAGQFLDADYLHGVEGAKMSRSGFGKLGKQLVSGEHTPGALDEFITKHAEFEPESEFERKSRQTGEVIGLGAVPGSMVGVALGRSAKERAVMGGLGAAAGAAMVHGGHRLSHHMAKREKTASLLTAILPTIHSSHLFEFKSALVDPQIESLLHKNAAAVLPSVELLLNAPERPKFASAFANLVNPTVVQLKRVDDGYRLKTASHVLWEPIVQTIDRGEALQRFGEKVVLAAELSGAVTMADGADAIEPEHDSDMEAAQPITESGLYKVQTPDGQEAVGYVIPNLLDIDGTAIPLSLFTNGTQATVQGDIVGVRVEGEAIDLPSSDVPSGRGVFASADGSGQLQATIPLTIEASMEGIEEGEPTMYRAESFTGEPILVSCQPNIQTVVGTEDGKMLVPMDWQWVPLTQADDIALESQEDGLGKAASALQAFPHVELVSAGGDTFSFRGGLVEKLAHDQRELLGVDDAMFLLAGLGVEQGYGVRKLAEAATGKAPVKVCVGRHLKLASDQMASAIERAREIVASMPDLRQPLWKEAAALNDPQSVDAVLALGFLNPENLTTFIGYLPLLEDAQAKLCDVLLASRLGGLIDTPEGAIERAVRSVEAVLEGLKALAFQQN